VIKRLVWAAALLLILGAMAGGEASKQAALRHHFAPGETTKYHGQVQGDGTITFMGEKQPVKIAGQFDLTQKVLEVAADGSARIATTVEPERMVSEVVKDGATTRTVTRKIEGGVLIFQTPDVTQRLPITLPVLTQTIAPDGRLLKTEGWEGEAGEPSRGHINLRRVIERILLLQFPEQAVAVGDSWVQRAAAPSAAAAKPEAEGAPKQLGSAPPPAQPVAPTWKLTLIGLPRVGQWDCARIRATAESPIKQVLPPDRLGEVIEMEGTERLETITDFALSAGRVVRQTASAHTTVRTLTHPAAGGQPVSGETDITAKVILELR